MHIGSVTFKLVTLKWCYFRHTAKTCQRLCYWQICISLLASPESHFIVGAVVCYSWPICWLQFPLLKFLYGMLATSCFFWPRWTVCPKSQCTDTVLRDDSGSGMAAGLSAPCPQISTRARSFLVAVINFVRRRISSGEVMPYVANCCRSSAASLAQLVIPKLRSRPSDINILRTGQSATTRWSTTDRPRLHTGLRVLQCHRTRQTHLNFGKRFSFSFI